MSTDEYRTLIYRWVEEVWNGGKLERADELMAPSYVLHAQSDAEPIRGAAGFKELCLGYRTAFPDLKMTIEDFFTEGDRCVWRFSVQGTQRGPLPFGVPATGRSVRFSGMVISRFA